MGQLTVGGQPTNANTPIGGEAVARPAEPANPTVANQNPKPVNPGLPEHGDGAKPPTLDAKDPVTNFVEGREPNQPADKPVNDKFTGGEPGNSQFGHSHQTDKWGADGKPRNGDQGGDWGGNGVQGAWNGTTVGNGAASRDVAGGLFGNVYAGPFDRLDTFRPLDRIDTTNFRTDPQTNRPTPPPPDGRPLPRPEPTVTNAPPPGTPQSPFNSPAPGVPLNQAVSQANVQNALPQQNFSPNALPPTGNPNANALNPTAQPGAAAANAAAQSPSQAALTLSPAQAVNAAQRASAAQAQGQLAANQMALSNAAGRANSGNAQAVAMAQSALALTLGRAMAGQMTAGGAAMALAEGQLALRASRLAQAQLQIQSPAAAQGQRGMAVVAGAQGRAAALAQGVGAAGAQVASQGARGALPGQAAPTQALAPRAGQLPQGAAKTGDGSLQAQLAAGATMPRELAATLAMAPKLRKRGSHGAVEKVDRFTPRSQQPEMEDEDFWDALGDEGEEQHHSTDVTPEEAGAAQAAAEAAAQHYRALHVWLQANDQAALLRELALGRRVLVLAPPDKTHLRLIGHMLWPDAAGPSDAVRAAGARGRAWPLAARWSAMLPADVTWRQWRLRQWVDAGGRWQVAASQPDRHTPRLLLAGEAHDDVPVAVGEYITVVEPRRLRRLMGRQWTMVALRVPVPLDGVGAQSAVVGGR